MNSDLVRIVDAISRDKNIEKESVFVDLEAAMLSAARRAYDEVEDIEVRIDRLTGEIEATVEGKPIDMKTLGRIAAQTAKQVMIQRIREDERNSVFEEYSQRVGEVVTGSVTRYEGGSLLVNIGRAEAFLPRSEQIPGESHQPGERIRGMILDVREEPHQVRIVITQTHPDYIRKLFELEVPEVGERIIEIRALAREAGYRTKVAVSSIDSKVDAVGACVGVRGSRIRNIVDELGGEKIDIVRWNESSQVLISNALKPAEVSETFLSFELGRATVIVEEEQLSLAIGKRGQNVRLAARLTGWDIDIQTPAEYNKAVDDMERVLKGVDGVEDVVLDKLLAIGVISLADLEEVGTEPLVNEIGLDNALATQIVELAGVEAKRIAAQAAQARAEKQAAEAEAAAKESEKTEPDSAEAEETQESEPAVADAGAQAAAVDEEAAAKESEKSEPDSAEAEETQESEPAVADASAQAAAVDEEAAASDQEAGVEPQAETLPVPDAEPALDERAQEAGAVESSEST